MRHAASRTGFGLAGMVLGVGLTAALSSSAEPTATHFTIPYSGYLDFDGNPVNAGNVKFNFALFPCPTPGPGASECASLWTARGAWNDAQSGLSGWPSAGTGMVALPVFAGRFTVELGADGQNPLPDVLLTEGYDTLYLAIQIEGRSLGQLQKITSAVRSLASAEADRFRVRSAVEIDDPSGGAARLSAADGLVVEHSLAAQERLMRVGDALTVERDNVIAPSFASDSISAGQVSATTLTSPTRQVDIDGVATPDDNLPTFRSGLVYDSSDRLDAFMYGNSQYTLVNGRPTITLTGGYLAIQQTATQVIRPAPNKGWTASLWFKDATGTGQRALLHTYACTTNATSLEISAANRLSFNFRAVIDQGFTVDTPLTDSNWHHVAGVRDTGGFIHLYLDGVEVGSTQANLNGHWDTDLPWYIGASTPCGSGPTNFFQGNVDTVRVYQRALPASEIAAFYTATKGLHP